MAEYITDQNGKRYRVDYENKKKPEPGDIRRVPDTTVSVPSAPTNFAQRLLALREKWLEQLEQVAAKGPRPDCWRDDSAKGEGTREVYWGQWQVQLAECIRVATETLLLDASPSFGPTAEKWTNKSKAKDAAIPVRNSLQEALDINLESAAQAEAVRANKMTDCKEAELADDRPRFWGLAHDTGSARGPENPFYKDQGM